jgi:hypothetical protein
MTPDPHSRRKKATRIRRDPKSFRTGSSPDDAHDVVFFRRHPADDPAQSTPGREALESYPAKVRATMRAVLVAVAASPPKKFTGGGYWEAMKGDMTGWFEVRVDGPKRHHYRLFCRLDYQAKNASKPLLVIIAGLEKPFRTVLSDADYAGVRRLGEEYLSRNPRCLV